MVYLLEDDESIRKLVVYALENQGFEAAGFETPPQFWEAMKVKIPELVLLDVMLPYEDGLTVLRKIRREPSTAHVPVVMLTAKNTEFDRVDGLDSGADDYISKPFGMMELLARVRAVLRRAGGGAEVREFRFGELFLCPDRHEVAVAGEPVTLTFKEYSLLLLLCENAGNVLTRQVLMDRVWGLAAEYENRTLDVHVRTLRAKLCKAGELIETVRGVGYRLRK